MSPTMTTSFINQMVDKFYEYMGTVFLEYYQLPEKPMITIENINIGNDINNNDDIINNNDDKMENLPVEIQRIQTFSEYFLYKLYYNYGIKRRMVNEHVALLFYAKNLKGYKANEYITMLCRHMMLDLTNMRIISLGVPKAMKLEEFIKVMNIDKTNSATNIINSDKDSNVPKYKVYKFPEGTMITYNPSLCKYNVNTTELASNDNQEPNDEDKEAIKHSEIIAENIEKGFQQQFQYSTRKVVGTGRFSSLKTFMEMFNENNEIANVDLSKVPIEIMQDKVMVFNIEHPENKVVSNNVNNYNTLCAVYQFKSESQTNNEFADIQSLSMSISNDDNINKIR
jgi:hypothetical protein